MIHELYPPVQDFSFESQYEENSSFEIEIQ